MFEKRSVFGLILASIVLSVGAASALAAGCPISSVQESGGDHWCYVAKGKGHVHLWKPAAYDPKTAVTVVYVHGNNLKAGGGQVTGKGVGYDGCANAHYIDCAWDKHELAAQFSKSGLNALFVAVEGQANAWQDAYKWSSLGALMKSIKREGGLKPPASVVAIGHSAGIFTVKRFLDDARLIHVVSLDALYADSASRLKAWYRAARINRLTLVGADSRHVQTTALGRKLSCASVSLADPYPRADACVAAVDPVVGHMAVVTGGDAIPLSLSRVVAPVPAKKKPAAKAKRKPRRAK